MFVALNIHVDSKAEAKRPVEYTAYFQRKQMAECIIIITLLWLADG